MYSVTDFKNNYELFVNYQHSTLLSANFVLTFSSNGVIIGLSGITPGFFDVRAADVCNRATGFRSRELTINTE